MAGRGGGGPGGVGGAGGSGSGACAGKTLAGNVTATANADLTQLADVTTLTGSLSIGGTVTNLTALTCLTRVMGNVSVSGASALTSFTLGRLSDVGGRVLVQNDAMLTTVGLPALASIGSTSNQALALDTLPKLTSVDVHLLTETPASSGISIATVGSTAAANLTLNFAALATVRGLFSISAATNLINLDGFAALRTVGGRVYLVNNPALLNTGGLGGLRQVTNDVFIQGDAALTTVDLHSLMTVGSTNNQSLVFDTLPKLTAIDVRALAETPASSGVSIVTVGGTAAATLTLNFAALATVRSTLDISAVANLVNLDGLAALRTVGGRLYLVNNPALLNTGGLGGLRQVGDDVFIQGDATLTTIDLHSLMTVGTTSNQSLMFDALPKLTAIDVRALAETPASSGIAITQVGSTAAAALTMNFAALTTVRNTLNLSQVANLVNLDGLAALRTVSGRLIVANDAALLNTTGLGGVRQVGNDVSIQSDAALTTIDLHSLMTVGSASNQSLLFDTLPKLTAVDVRALAETAASAGIALTQAGSTAAGTLTLNFAALTTVRNTLNISQVANLANLDGLAALKTVSGRLVVATDAALANTTGLGAVQQVGGDVFIQNDAALTAIDLHSLTSVGATNNQSLVFDAHPKLTTIDVRALTETAASGGIAITQNGGTAAGNLTVNFAALAAVRGTLSFTTVANLVSLGGLGALKTITGGLTISANAKLTDLATGLPMVTMIGGNFTVTNNATLCKAPVVARRDAIAAAGGVGGTTTITGNKDDC